MKKFYWALCGIGLLFAAERVYLEQLERSVVNDTELIDQYLRSLPKADLSKFPFERCRIAGGWSPYQFQLCLQLSSSASCTIPTYAVQYLPPKGIFSLYAKETVDQERRFRVSILKLNADGTVCIDYRGVE